MVFHILFSSRYPRTCYSGHYQMLFFFRSMLDTSSCGVFPCFLQDHLKSEDEVHGSMVWSAPVLSFNEFFFNNFSEAIL